MNGTHRLPHLLPRLVRWSSLLFIVAVTACCPPSSRKQREQGKEAATDWCEQAPNHDCLARSCQAAPFTVAVFKASWCGWCRRYEDTTLKDPQVVKRLAPFQRVMVDVDVNEDVAAQHAVKSVPITVFFGAQCRELGRLEGYAEPAELLKALDAAEKKVQP